MALRNNEAVRPDYFELYFNFRPYSDIAEDDGKREVTPNSMRLVAGRMEFKFKIINDATWNEPSS